ncbi:MAG TPA: response regulator [Lacunisphaera sp.]|nr:response regulator [Lacunisphaera sp.]
MPTTSSRPPQRPPLSYGPLAPFGALALFGLVVLFGWWTGHVTLVQPRSYDAALPANAALCFVLIGLTPIFFRAGWKRAGRTVGLAASLLALATLFESFLAADFGLDQLLVHHEMLVAGPHVARMPAALAATCTLSALLVTWLAVRPYDLRLPRLLGLTGSLVLAYALTTLFAYRNGLNGVPAWQAYAQAGPHTAAALILLGGGLIFLGARSQPDVDPAGPEWLWLPVTLCGITLTIGFWVSLRERERVYIHQTTQLTMDHLAGLFDGEVGFMTKALGRFAVRSAAPDKARWEREAAALVEDLAACRSIQFLDGTGRTRWYWPVDGNEGAAARDHQADPLRRAALAAAGQPPGFGITAPLGISGESETFAVYVPVADGLGFIAGEFYYEKYFGAIDRRLNLSARYQTRVAIEGPAARRGAGASVTVYDTPAGQDEPDARLQRTAHYNILDQHLTITLTPRPAFIASGRQYLPELTLCFGVGVSALLGLVTNLAQAARRRQLAAESTSRQLRLENEERRRVEARLKTADERLNLAFESTLAGVFEWDLETDQVYLTASIWKMMGTVPIDMPTSGTGWLALLHDDDRAAVRAVMEAHFRGETPLIEIEHCVHLASGEWLWIALRAKCTAFSAARHPRRVLGTVQNINARKRSDEALRASQAESRKLSLVASKTDNAVIITDPTGRIEWANESYSRLTGRPLGSVVGQPLLRYLASPDADPAVLGRITAALDACEPISTEAIQLATEERRFHVHLDLQPVSNEEGQVENFIVIATDITARAETEQELRRAKEEADSASRSKSEFLASMSHEIRTPMNGVIGMTSLLLETDLTPEQRDYVSTIRTSGDALLSIINEILDFSKIESGKMELDNQPFELAQCVEEVVDIFAAQAAAKGIELAYIIDRDIPPCILGDITRLRQVLVNLTNNAVKFTPRGFITLEARLAPDARPESGSFLLDFLVTDTGIGIPPDRFGLLFKPFSQVDSTTTRKYGGTGLGLAICHRLCTMMGGSIDVQSVPGQGSRFRFCIETSVVNLPDHQVPPFPPLVVKGPVLAVDDHPVNRLMLDQSLRAWGLQPLLAGSPDEAAALAANTRFAAAVIDQDQGGASGVELIARLRANQPHLPVVLLAPAHGSQKRDVNLDALVFRLPKPIKPYPLYDALRRVIAGAAAQAGTPSTPPIPTGRLAEALPLEILLVEDNPVNTKVAMTYLERMGYKAVAAANGVEAVAAVQHRKFDLVFMDLQMPEMDGLAATREIRRSLPKERQPVIVALSANAMPSDREQCLAAGMNDHLAKPIKIEEIQGAIHRHFGKKTA